MKGFSLLEILIVITILIAISGLAVPIYRNFYGVQQLDGAVDELTANLYLIQGRALNGFSDSSWGIHWAGTEYTIFQGSDYDTRSDFSFDQTVPIPDSLSLTATADVIFNQLTGQSDSAVTITISNSRVNETKTITINQEGLISK